MSADTLAAPAGGVAVRSGSVRTLLVLARQESRRLLLHPISLVGWAVFLVGAVVTMVRDFSPSGSWEAVDMMLSFYPGVLLILVGNLAASRDERAGSSEMLAALPVGRDRRTAALLLAATTQAALGLVVIAAVHGANLLRDAYVLSPSVWHVMQAPITLAGAVLLGVLAARWLPARGTVVVLMLGIVVLNAWLNSQESGRYFGPAMSWAAWSPTAGEPWWAGVFPGSPAWRDGYLLGLTVLAGLGAMLTVTRRRRTVVVLAVVVLALTALCGWRMLP